MKILSLTLVLFFVMISGCKKDDSEVLRKDAIVMDSGSPALDGCGWLIKVDDTFYAAEALDDKFKVDGMVVSLSYKLTQDKYSCSFSSLPPLEVIRIVKIQGKD